MRPTGDVGVGQFLSAVNLVVRALRFSLLLQPEKLNGVGPYRLTHVNGEADAEVYISLGMKAPYLGEPL